MEHLEIWQKVARPPESALKKIQGGRLSGMTDINPQWRLKAMTEVFGPCGIGWKYDIVRQWTEPGPAGEVLAFTQVALFVRRPIEDEDGKGTYWSDPIPGIGGSMLVAKESSGLRANDEAFKMSLTDALSVAMKQLGVASDIYERKYDGSKYTEPEGKTALERPKSLSAARPPDAPSQGPPPAGARTASAPLTLDGELSPEEKWGRLLNKAELQKLTAFVKGEGVTATDLRAFVKEAFGIESGTELREHMLGKLTTWVKAHGKEMVA